MDDCLFCSILRGDAPASFVYRDETCAAFLDLFPLVPGHLLVVPVDHAAHLADLSPEQGAALFGTARRLADALRKSGLRCDGVTLTLADGAPAGQEIFHAHLHVIPRWRGDGFGWKTPPGYPREADRAALDEAARRIAAAIG
jgi:diadenosine tetraphosphate (Ap4A) HIT family hydrolase